MPHTLTAQTALQMLQAVMVMFGGIVSIKVAGIEMYLNEVEEESWIEVEPGFDRYTWKSLMRLVGDSGWELMDEDEGIEERPDGKVRHWIARVPRLTCEEMNRRE